MRAKTKTEKEVVRLSKKMPGITEAQKKWALRMTCYEEAGRFRGKPTEVLHFIIATTSHGWQVLRHFYLYATYRYKKLHKAEFYVVMEEWMKDGEYVFLSLNRMQGYCNDAWCLGQEMEVKRGLLGGAYLRDPREIGYCDVLFVRVQEKYKYLPKDIDVEEGIGQMFRAVNAHPYNETLLKQNLQLFKWSRKNGFAYDHEKTAAIRIANRYHYEIDDIWRDMIDMLAYLKKDLHNPTLVCPKSLQEGHDRWSKAAANKRKKISERMAKLRQIADERRELRRLEMRAQWEAQRKEEAKAAIPFYTKMRGKFFGLVFAENDIEIKVLQSVQEFMEEGKEMEHCVFANGYYDVRRKPHCLILSAKVNGARCETIEVDLSQYKVVQCRGKHNTNTAYHDRILHLMDASMNAIKNVNERTA